MKIMINQTLTLAIELKRYEFEFPIIAIAETNEGSDIKDLNQLQTKEASTNKSSSKS